MNVDDTGLFAGEQPAPITVDRTGRRRSTSAKKGRSASGKRSLSAKKPSGKATYDQRQTNKYKKSIDSLRKKIGAKSTASKPLESGGWNDSTTASKYFDNKVDPREMRMAQNRQKDSQMPEKAAKIFKASGNAIQVKTAPEEPGKYNVEF